MRKENFEKIMRIVDDDPLTDAQIRAISGADADQVIGAEEAAAMLGVTVKHLRTMKGLPRLQTNGRFLKFLLKDIRRYRDGNIA